MKNSNTYKENKMQESVKLISYTHDALELLLYTKNTRLEGGATIQDIKAWPEEKKLEHLYYMRNTIKSRNKIFYTQIFAFLE